MRFRTAIRATGAHWFVPVSFALMVYVGLSDPPIATGYDVVDLSGASRGIYLLGPLSAAFVALKFRGFPAVIHEARPLRSGVAVVLRYWWPLLLMTPIAGVVGMFSVTRALPQSRQEFQIVLVVFATILACACLGLLVGRILPVVLSIPAVALLTFAWLALPGSGTNILFRNINSSFVGCCSTRQQPAQEMILGSLTLVITIAVGTVAVLVHRRWASQSWFLASLITVTVIAVAFTLGALRAKAGDPLNLLAVEPRSTPLQCKAEANIRACVWPEDVARLPGSVALLREFNESISAVGLGPVRTITEARPDASTTTFSAGLGSSKEDVKFSLVVGFVQKSQQCGGDDGRASDNQSAIAYVSMLAGIDARRLALSVPRSAIVEAARVPKNGTDGLEWFIGAVCPRGSVSE